MAMYHFTDIRRDHFQIIAGFTLIELLIVIGIISVLSIVVVVIIDPVEMLKNARDSQRLSDLQLINRALSLAKTDGLVSSFGNSRLGTVGSPPFWITSSNLSSALSLPGFSAFELNNAMVHGGNKSSRKNLGLKRWLFLFYF